MLQWILVASSCFYGLMADSLCRFENLRVELLSYMLIELRRQIADVPRPGHPRRCSRWSSHLPKDPGARAVSTVMESDEHRLLRIDDMLAEDSRHRFLRSRAAVSGLDSSMRLRLRLLRMRMQWSLNRCRFEFRPQSQL